MNRIKEIETFFEILKNHVANYTVPQYGDAPNDLATNYTKEYCVKQIEKYAKRHGKNQRADQENMDLLKIAHYAIMAYYKD
jgi:hypothetical protein